MSSDTTDESIKALLEYVHILIKDDACSLGILKRSYFLSTFMQWHLDGIVPVQDGRTGLPKVIKHGSAVLVLCQRSG